MYLKRLLNLQKKQLNHETILNIVVIFIAIMLAVFIISIWLLFKREPLDTVIVKIHNERIIENDFIKESNYNHRIGGCLYDIPFYGSSKTDKTRI